jgi:hypothetical protein
MVGKVLIGAGDGVAASQVFGLERVPVRCQNELGLGLCGRRACLQRDQSLRDLAGRGNGNMDVVGLKNPAKVGLVRLALTQAFERRFVVAENGNSAASNGCSARADIASSISTAFMLLPAPDASASRRPLEIRCIARIVELRSGYAPRGPLAESGKPPKPSPNLSIVPLSISLLGATLTTRDCSATSVIHAAVSPY